MLNVASGSPCSVNGLAIVVACEFEGCWGAIVQVCGRSSFATGGESGDTQGSQFAQVTDRLSAGDDCDGVHTEQSCHRGDQTMALSVGGGSKVRVFVSNAWVM
jgi:hypothetical protein